MRKIGGTTSQWRSHLALHPDGSVFSTQGCIGLRNSLAKVRECLEHIAREGVDTIDLDVHY